MATLGPTPQTCPKPTKELDYEQIGRHLRAIRIIHTRPKFDTPLDEVERNCRQYAEQSFAFYNPCKPTDQAWIDRMTKAYTDEAMSLNLADYIAEWRLYWPARSPAEASK